MPRSAIPCVECGTPTQAANLKGFVSCPQCGKLAVAPEGMLDELESPTVDAVAEEALDDYQGDVELPDYANVMIGWRAWGVPIDRDGPPRLHSVSHGDYFWTPREPIEATCQRQGGRSPGLRARNSSSHEPPMEACSCGLYSAKTREHLTSMSYHKYDAERQAEYHVIGTVSLWGKVIEGTQGWRAQYGYPRELFVPFEAWALAKPLSEAYGVPVRLNNILGLKSV